MSSDESVRHRLARLLVQLLASPTLALLGVTKIVESIVAGGPLLAWIGWAWVATSAYAFGDELVDGLDDATETDLHAVEKE